MKEELTDLLLSATLMDSVKLFPYMSIVCLFSRITTYDFLAFGALRASSLSRARNFLHQHR